MSNHSEEKMTKMLDFPFDAFLMVRLEYVQICKDDLEAKLLRIIEKYVETERKRRYQAKLNAVPGIVPSHAPLEIPADDIWVSISHRAFMSDLFGTVTSENTLKKALRNLKEKRLIFSKHDQEHRYDAPEYRLHISAMQMLLNVLASGGQKLIPSIIDTLKKLPPQYLTPSECQLLIPSSPFRGSNIDPNITVTTDNITDNSNYAQDANALATHTHENVIEAEMSSQSTKGHEDAQPPSLVPPSCTQTPRTSGGTGDHPLLPQVLTPPVAVESPLPPLVATPASLDTDTPARPQRKPSKPKEDTSTPERIEAVFVCMEATIRRLTEQDDFTFGRTKKAREAVKDLLTGRVVTPEKMDWHICRLWNKPKDPKSGFYWQENMSVVAICNNYDREIVNYRPARAMNSPTAPVAVPSLAARMRAQRAEFAAGGRS